METVNTAIEIFVFFLCFFFLLRSFQGTRAAGVLKGLIIFLVFAFVGLMYSSEKLELVRVRFVLEKLVPAFAIIFIILFQPELRKIFVKIGQGGLLAGLFKHEHTYTADVVDAAFELSTTRTGAIFAIEKDMDLSSYAEEGTKVDSEVTPALLKTIFYPGSPLHDGGVIIKSGRVFAAGCVFPLSDTPDISKALGTRHRAGIGLAEETDAFVIIVSEETGAVSSAIKGQLKHGLAREELIAALAKFHGIKEAASNCTQKT